MPQQPPADAWDNIQKHLPQEDRRPLFPFWGRMAAVALLIGLISGTGYLWYNSNVGIQENPVVNIPSENSLETNIPSAGNSGHERQNAAQHFQNPAISSGNSNEISNENALEIPSGNSFYSREYSTNYLLAQNENRDFQTENIQQISTFINGIHAYEMLNQSGIAVRNYLETPELKLIQYPHHFDQFETQNQIAKSEKNKSNKKKFNTDLDRFTVSGFVSPMALNTFVGTSMLSDVMSDYKTVNNITLAYGLKGAYALNDRLKVRTGISVVGFEQVTKDVSFTLEPQKAIGMTYTDPKSNIQYYGNLRIENRTGEMNPEELTTTVIGDVKQQSQYIEIPLEVEVGLFERGPIGISLTGGGSTWLLSKNQIYADTKGFTEELGRADNLNKTSFSANAGLKFDMELSENVQLNVEPTFKYLINPVNRVEKYSPYTVGVNAGISVTLK